MMTCHDVETFLDDYLEGSLSWVTRVRFEFHLRMCAECRRYIARYKAAIELGQKLLAPHSEQAADTQVPADFIDIILRSVREQE